MNADALSSYLEEIGRYPLLSREQEAAVAAKTRSGDHDALNALVCANLRFVVIIAKKYRHRGVPFTDLIAEGNLGLVRAAERFDYNRGVKFISYAVWWIRQSILQCLADNGHTMRVPAAEAATIRRIGSRASQLTQELGREPTQRELAEQLGMPERVIVAALPVTRAPLSLDAPPGMEGGMQLLDIVSHDDGPASDDAATASDVSSIVDSAIRVLRPRDRQVLTMYFGLDGAEPRTLEEIGERYGVTRERIRQIKDRALSRLRRSKQATALEALR